MWRPRPKFKVSFYLYFCCFWINVTQINFENIKRKIQRIISDSCFQLKSWCTVDIRAPSIPLLNFPFNVFEIITSLIVDSPFNYHNSSMIYIVSWEQECRWCTAMFRWEPEGRNRCTKYNVVSLNLESEGRYCSSKMFGCESEGRYFCTKSMEIAPNYLYFF